jgi:uncharacterized protein related to proFAR isomerase
MSVMQTMQSTQWMAQYWMDENYAFSMLAMVDHGTTAAGHSLREVVAADVADHIRVADLEVIQDTGEDLHVTDHMNVTADTVVDHRVKVPAGVVVVIIMMVVLTVQMVVPTNVVEVVAEADRTKYFELMVFLNRTGLMLMEHCT